jgi:hypothetical protein
MMAPPHSMGLRSEWLRRAHAGIQNCPARTKSPRQPCPSERARSLGGDVDLHRLAGAADESH